MGDFSNELESVGNQLVANCNAGHAHTIKGLDGHYHPSCVYIEALTMPGNDSPETLGLEAIKAKHEWWNNTFDTHHESTEGPFFHGDNQFTAIFTVDVTNREAGERLQTKEVGLYAVEAGKIIKEQFFYQSQ